MNDIIERLDFDEKNINVLHAEHIVRYSLAIPYVRGKKVLDLACGTGYGSFFLSLHSQEIIGVDISPEAIQSARKKYQRNNLSFVVSDAMSTPFQDHSFDVIVSFETIEHIKNDLTFLKEVKRILKQEGLLLLSCPNIVWSKKHDIHNPFHFREYTEKSILRLVSSYFKFSSISSQYDVGGSLILHDKLHPSTMINLSHNKHTFPKIPTSYIVLCSDNEKIEIQDLISLARHETFDDILNLIDYIKQLKLILLKEDSKILTLFKIKLGRALKKSKKLVSFLSK